MGPQVYGVFQTANPEMVLAVIVTIVFIWWLVFTIVAAYHLFRYATESWMTVPALAVHLAVSVWIFVFATGGFH
jgi:hypothetical protein